MASTSASAMNGDEAVPDGGEAAAAAGGPEAQQDPWRNWWGWQQHADPTGTSTGSAVPAGGGEAAARGAAATEGDAASNGGWQDSSWYRWTGAA